MSTAVKLSKLLITRYKNKLFAISYEGNIANEIEYIENNSLLGSIHIGRVKKISKNIMPHLWRLNTIKSVRRYILICRM